MPPHLHPRSTATSTLFAGTLLASFVVVGIPHVFPCPRPRTGYADAEIQLDEDGRPIRRRIRRGVTESSSTTSKDQELTGLADVLMRNVAARKGLAQSKDLEEEAALFRDLQREAEALEKEARECPVPKPRGVIGRFLGFEDKKLIVENSNKERIVAMELQRPKNKLHDNMEEQPRPHWCVMADKICVAGLDGNELDGGKMQMGSSISPYLCRRATSVYRDGSRHLFSGSKGLPVTSLSKNGPGTTILKQPTVAGKPEVDVLHPNEASLSIELDPTTCFPKTQGDIDCPRLTKFP